MYKILLAMLVALTLPVSADEDSVAVRGALAKIIPGMTPDSIKPSEVPGLSEVVYGAEVYYITDDGRYFFNGSIVDLKAGKNITEDKRATGRLSVVSSVDESSMLIYSPEKVKHSITVFTDIDCTYCRRMHREMGELNAAGIEIRYLFFPRAGKGSKSYYKAVSVWCADDRHQAMDEAKAGKNPPRKSCENPVDEHMALVERLGITGTPTMIMVDGTVIPGYVPAARLIPALESGGDL